MNDSSLSGSNVYLCSLLRNSTKILRFKNDSVYNKYGEEVVITMNMYKYSTGIQIIHPNISNVLTQCGNPINDIRWRIWNRLQGNESCYERCSHIQQSNHHMNHQYLLFVVPMHFHLNFKP